MLWTRTSRSHDISGPVEEVSVLVVLDGGACSGALQGGAGPSRRQRGRGSTSSRGGRAGSTAQHSTAPRSHRTHHATPHATENAPRDRHDPSSVVPNNQTMERLPVRQATIGMVCRTCCYRADGWRCGAATGRQAGARPPAAGTGRGGEGPRDPTHTSPTRTFITHIL